MDVRLVMFRQDGSRRDFPLIDGVTTIGRRQDCSIRIPLSEVSRCHAEVRLSDHTVIIKDLGAANGTFLNTRRIKDEEKVAPGDQISIGPVVFTVQINGEPADGDIVEVRTKTVSRQATQAGAGVSTSEHVYMSDDEIDPISALEALAASDDQTSINMEEDDEEEFEN